MCSVELFVTRSLVCWRYADNEPTFRYIDAGRYQHDCPCMCWLPVLKTLLLAVSGGSVCIILFCRPVHLLTAGNSQRDVEGILASNLQDVPSLTVSHHGREEKGEGGRTLAHGDDTTQWPSQRSVFIFLFFSPPSDHYTDWRSSWSAAASFPMLMLCPLASPSTYVLRTRLVLVLYKFLIYHLLLLRDILS